MIEPGYYRAFIGAFLLHVGLLCFLCIDAFNSHQGLQTQAPNQPGIVMPDEVLPSDANASLKAHSVDSAAVMETLTRIKKEKAIAHEQEQARQLALKKEAQQLRVMRQREQQRLARLQQEALKVAALQKKKVEEEQQRLKQIAAEAAVEKARVTALQQQQKVLEAQKVQAQKEAEAREAAKLQAQQAEKAAAAREALKNQAAQQAKLAGEVNKYKALIINAIGQRWILPDNVNPALSTQFRIRLAPNGSVLEVTLIKSSGDALLDRSAQTAIYKASPLPVPVDPATFELFRDISLTVRPEKVRG